MSRKTLTSLIAVALLILAAVGLGLYRSDSGSGSCDINSDSGCVLNGITFTIGPRPVKAMRENVFRVRLDDPSLVPVNTDLALHLSMPAMDMGTNRLRLKNLGPGLYSGKGVIPRCPSGKKLWRASVLDISARELASFLFEVE